ncbi:MAG TPA: DUF1549 domain-containing protein [Gemmatales bacterium]|nr:DUF1549 domain-containing protein [Gemmatales bacterium]
MRLLSLSILLISFAGIYSQDGIFRDSIASLLQTKCLRCHSGSTPKGELDLSSERSLREGGSSGKVIAMDGKKSLLLEMIEQRKMPPKDKLTDAEIEAFRKWIQSGSKWNGPALEPKSTDATPKRAGKDWWSLQPIRRSALPATRNSGWIRQPIDTFILNKLESNGLGTAPEADRRTYLRRVKFDLLGLPPTPEEITQFQADTAPDAYEKLIDRLLASPHYGERWGRHWLDVVRFAESHGYETNELRRSAWPYRDWVIRAFNEDKPFARFVQEQLAGDVVAAGDIQNEVATGFLVAGTHDVVGNATPEGMAQQRQDDLYDMVSATGSTFLGLTVNCARCHDHKFDPITQREYYGLQAVFAGTQHNTRRIDDPVLSKKLKSLEQETKPLASQLSKLEGKTSLIGKARAQMNTESFPAIEARYVRMTIVETERHDEPCIDEMEIYEGDTNVALSSKGAKASASSAFPDASIHRIVHLNDGQVGNSHSWISNEQGKGWAQIELPQNCKIDRIVWGRDRLRQFADRLPSKYRFEASLDGKTWTLLCTDQDRLHRQVPAALANEVEAQKELQKKLQALTTEAEALRSQLQVYCGSFKSPEKVYLLKRGDPMQKLEEVAPLAIASVGVPWNLSVSASDKERRLALANWIASPANPLPARVMVNRLWHYHFGTGLVNTPSDFGFNGGKPSHPELLDWLAAEYQHNGGRMKPLHKMIVLSATYRQASTTTEKVRTDAEKVDADNRLLWRFPRRRLEAEILRDSILAISGNLDLRMGGPGYDLWKYSNYVVVFEPREPTPADTFRRMVYQFKPRTQQDKTFGAFDCPDGTLTMPRRNTSTTALQALNLLNSEFMLDQSGRLAERLEKEAGSDPSRAIEHGFMLALGRKPKGQELETSLAVVRQHGLPVFCRALLNTNELIFID